MLVAPRLTPPRAPIIATTFGVQPEKRFGQISIQSEKCLKPYWASPGAVGQAPLLLEPARRPTRRGRTAPTREWELPYNLPERNPEVQEPLHSRYFRNPTLQNPTTPPVSQSPKSANTLGAGSGRTTPRVA